MNLEFNKRIGKGLSGGIEGGHLILIVIKGGWWIDLSKKKPLSEELSLGSFAVHFYVLRWRTDFDRIRL